MKAVFFGATLGTLSALAGCSTPLHCDELQKCGGDFLNGAPAAPEPPSLAYIPPRPAGMRAVEPSTIDWCAGLRLDNMGKVTAFDDGWYETLVKYDGWFPSIPLYTGELTIFSNNQYSVSFTQLVSQRAELTQTCLVAQGVNLSCEAINEQLAVFVAERLESIDGLVAEVYGNVCASDGEGGCNCDYNVSLTSGGTGPWEDGDGRIAFFDADAAPPGRADYCASGGTLQLTGSKGTDLFNRNGLKTLTWRQAP